jgi:hypothetical protein
MKKNIYTIGASIETPFAVITGITNYDIFESICLTEGSLYEVSQTFVKKYGINSSDSRKTIEESLRGRKAKKFKAICGNPHERFKKMPVKDDCFYELDNIDDCTMYYDSESKYFITGKDIKIQYDIVKNFAHYDGHKWAYPVVIEEKSIEVEYISTQYDSFSLTEYYKAKNGAEFEVLCSCLEGSFALVQGRDGTPLPDLGGI